jgi:hypothetical protein
VDGLRLLAAAEEAGLTVSTDGDRLVVRGPRRAEALARELIANKSRVLPYLGTYLPADWHVCWDERAAIMEYDGGLPREIAEHLALLEIVEQMNAAQQ